MNTMKNKDVESKTAKLVPYAQAFVRAVARHARTIKTAVRTSYRKLIVAYVGKPIAKAKRAELLKARRVVSSIIHAEADKQALNWDTVKVYMSQAAASLNLPQQRPPVPRTTKKKTDTPVELESETMTEDNLIDTLSNLVSRFGARAVRESLKTAIALVEKNHKSTKRVAA
jgi:hypothetical protein